MTETTAAPAATGMTWRRLLKWSAIAHVVVLLYVMAVIAQFPIPPVAITVLLFLVGLWWMRKPGRGGVILVGLLTIISAFQAMTVGGGTKVLPNPESWLDWISYAALIVVTVVGVIAFVGALRGGGGGGPRAVAVAGVVGLVATLAVGLVSGMGVDDDAQQAGDLLVSAKKHEFVPETLTAAAGDITVFLDNEDLAHHNFVIDDVVTLEMPAGHAARGTFRAAKGDYEFTCTIHPGMEGKLTVT